MKPTLHEGCRVYVEAGVGWLRPRGRGALGFQLQGGCLGVGVGSRHGGADDGGAGGGGGGQRPLPPRRDHEN